jgi:hypothetical protein
MIVQKFLRSLPLRFNVKVCVVEEMKDHDKMTMGELHGILTAYEIRIEKENPSREKQPSKLQRR